MGRRRDLDQGAEPMAVDNEGDAGSLAELPSLTPAVPDAADATQQQPMEGEGALSPRLQPAAS